MGKSNEQAYYDTLKRIASYSTLRQLKADSEKLYGLTYEEALEMAYDNMMNEAKSSLKGKRRPAEKVGERA